MQVDQSIFKAYDIRGIYPDQLNEEVAYAAAAAFAKLIQNENPGKRLNLAVGRDMRLSSPGISERVIAALRDSGCNVFDFDLVSTPTFYYGVAKKGYDGGIQVSASHNPPIYNGLKLVRAHAVPVTKNSGIREIGEMVAGSGARGGAATERGSYEKLPPFAAELVADQTDDLDLKKIKPMKLYADACNGMGSADIEALFAKIPQVQLLKANFEVDGSFPGHGEADPIKPAIFNDAGEQVRDQRCQGGFITDGDADRIVFVDEKGQVVRPGILFAVLAEMELRRQSGAGVVFDLRPSRIIQDTVEEHGGKFFVSQVGNPLIKEVMIQRGAVIGGETSGHMIYSFPYGVMEAPVRVIAKFLLYVSEREAAEGGTAAAASGAVAQGTLQGSLQGALPISDILLPFHKYFHSGDINIPLPDTGATEQKKAVEQKIAELKKIYADGKQSELDGLSVEYPEYWFNIRPSNTEPLMRLTVEATTREVMEQKRDEIIRHVNPQAKV